MELNTINRTDYKEKQVEPFVMGKGKKDEEKFLPFCGLNTVLYWYFGIYNYFITLFCVFLTIHIYYFFRNH